MLNPRAREQAAELSRLLRQAGRERVPTVGIPTLSAPGEEARIALKMNSLVDARCIQALYAASQALATLESLR